MRAYYQYTGELGEGQEQVGKFIERYQQYKTFFKLFSTTCKIFSSKHIHNYILYITFDYHFNLRIQFTIVLIQIINISLLASIQTKISNNICNMQWYPKTFFSPVLLAQNIHHKSKISTIKQMKQQKVHDRGYIIHCCKI